MSGEGLGKPEPPEWCVWLGGHTHGTLCEIRHMNCNTGLCPKSRGEAL